MIKNILKQLDFRTLNFKNRKAVHFALLASIIFLQLLLLVILYNEIFNESKLDNLETELEISDQAKHFSDLTKGDYIAIQYNLQNYIQTKDNKYLANYNKALNNLNKNIDSLAKTSNNSDSFLLYLKNTDSDTLSIKQLNKAIDSLINVQILPSPQLEKDLLKLNRFNYEDVLNSITVESYMMVDSVERKGLFTRLGNAITGKVDVQKEKVNVVVTMKYGKKVSTGNIEEQLANAFKNTNNYYQNEFLNYKNNLSALKGKDSDFLNRNNQLLDYSSLLLEKYNKALASFSNDTKHKFQDQYKTNKLIRNYAVIGLVLFMVIISGILILLTRLAFDYEKRLLLAQEKIQQNLSFKNRIVGMISHEIRSPLNILSIYSRNISKQIKDESLQESLKSIQFTTNSLSLLANQVLDYSKNENKKLELNKSEFKLKDELDEILKSLASFVENNNNKLEIKNTITENFQIHSDVVKIHQLFYNIVGNANKFTKKGIIKVDLKTEKTINNRLNLSIEIKDNGIGINEEDLQHIFESYYQGEISANVKNLGAGLGLNLCKELIELFDGKINVTSKKNVGTTVQFNLLLDQS
ncbi:sensor histidine kinase [Flavobacterium sp. UBA6195]|uniref:sensor histidine kinase n=1 Tax=Flavobacterium sp. UBA6195 TaxID=1946554 RepID=UPI0025C23318|nr:HAMP domain-containing sensor histidine kinase [Flavobacterium sp. UBA6195]